MSVYIDPLAERAAQRRALTAAWTVQCPRPDHFHAHPEVPCAPPDDEHPWGWACIERFELAATARESRRLARNHENHVHAVRRREWRDDAARRERAVIAARIAEAAHLTGADDRPKEQP
jgi:hypothetical protein